MTGCDAPLSSPPEWLLRTSMRSIPLTDWVDTDALGTQGIGKISPLSFDSPMFLPQNSNSWAIDDPKIKTCVYSLMLV